MAPVLIGVDYLGQWVEKAKCYTWVPAVKESRPILVSRTQVTYADLVEKIIQRWEISENPRDLCITYMMTVAKQKTAPSRIRNDDDVSLFMADVDATGARPTLRVNVVPRSEELSNSKPMENQGVEYVGDAPLNMDVAEKEEVGEAEQGESGVGNSGPAMSSVPSQLSNDREDGTGFYKGQTFANKRELVVLLKLAAVKKPFYFETVKNKKKVFCARCVDRNCRWWLRAIKYKSGDVFYITVYNGEHTCGSEHAKSHHPHATCDVIGEYMKSRFIDGKAPSTRDIKRTILADLGCNISYWKCLNGGSVAKSLARGTYEHGYACLDAYCFMIRKLNEGSKTGLVTDERGRFMYMFVSYGAWIRGFATIRKVLAVDGTFLTGPYGGVLLSAVGQDAENHIYPVAFCVVDKECDAAYEYFFEQLLGVIPDSDELCIVSDRHKSIEKAVSKFFPSAHYGYCIRHLGENLRSTFHCGDLLSKYYLAAEAYRLSEFKTHFKEIETLDPRVAKYLVEKVGLHKWTRCHFTGNRYAVTTTNIAESVNAMFRDVKDFPIDALFTAITKNYAEKFHHRRMEFLQSSNTCVKMIEAKISLNNSLGSKLVVHQKNNVEFDVSGGGTTDKDATVDLHNKTCTCREFDYDKIPCRHAMAAIRMKFGTDYGRKIYDYTSPYYYVDSYLLAYAETVHTVPDEEFWEDCRTELVESRPSIPYVKPKRGRRRIKRIPSIGERFASRKNRCSICKRIGHKKTTCPTVTRPPVVNEEGTSDVFSVSDNALFGDML